MSAELNGICSAGEKPVQGAGWRTVTLPIPGQFNGNPTVGPVNDQDAGIRSRCTLNDVLPGLTLIMRFYDIFRKITTVSRCAGEGEHHSGPG
jgi:hypothetical protein